MKYLKWCLAAITIMALALVAAGCGGQDKAKEAGQPTDKAQQKITVATEPTFKPFEFQDTNTQNFEGFDMDIIRAVGEAVGLEVEIKNLGFDGIIPALQTGQVNAAASGITIKPEREKQVNFTVPYYQSGLSIAVKSDNNTIKSLDDLKGKRIAVQIGTTGADMAKTVEGADVRTLNTADLLFMELKKGSVDAVINDNPVNMYYITEQSKKGDPGVKVVGDKLSSEFYGIAVSKNNPELLEKLNEGLKIIKENGKYAEIYKKWFGEEPPAFLPGKPAN